MHAGGSEENSKHDRAERDERSDPHILDSIGGRAH